MFNKIINKMSLGYSVFYYPREKFIDPCVNPWLAFITTAYPPRNYPNSHPPFILQL